jgi:heme A synthase
VKARADRDRFGLLLAMLVTVYVLSAFVSATWVRIVQVFLFLAVALLAVRNSRVRRRAALLALAATVAGSATALILVITVKSGPGAGVGYLLMALGLTFAAVLVMYRVLAWRQDVTLESIFGAISVYMIIGLMFALFYAAINEFTKGAFFVDGEPANVKTFQYFSFTTLTTLGYGDFTAAGSGGRAVAVMEALFGQVFLATLVARLVAAYRGPQRPGDDERAGNGQDPPG